MENKIKYLEMIQSVINRMANNSFCLKGWTVTLVSGILAISNWKMGQPHFYIVLIPILAFWGLDSYYLLQERLYRSLYEKTCNTDCEVDFLLKTSAEEKVFKQYLYCIFSKSIFFFYIPLLLVCVAIKMITHTA